jgi:hypothetical protein
LASQRLQPRLEELEKRELLATSSVTPLHFDFGTRPSPVAGGHTGVALTPYTPTLGYGWQSLTGLSLSDQGSAAAWTNAAVHGTDGTFLVDLANGTYNVTPTLGDSATVCDQVALYAQGRMLVYGVSTAAGEFVSPSYQVQVSDGQLELRFVDGGGLPTGFSLDALDITPAAPSGGSSSGGASSAAGRSASTRSSTPYYQIASGLYSLCPADGDIPSGVLSNSHVDGIAVRADWSFIEPSHGNYKWSYLDGVINAATSAGKKVSLSITAGTSTPAWVYKAGAQSFTFIDASSPSVQTIPVPWDPVFLTQWTNLITALGNRYAGNTTLTQVKLTGINAASAETWLPRSTGVNVTAGKKTWTTTDDVANWVAIGYTRTLVENAWQTIASAWSQAFPQQQIAAMLVPSGFPPINNNGKVFHSPTGADGQVTTDFLNLGMANYTTQYVAMNDALSDYWIMTQVCGVADQVTTGYQMLWMVTGDKTYRMNSGTPIAIKTELQNAVNAALTAHARYLEIYPEDITNSNLQGVLASAHTGLVNNALPLGMITGLPAAGSVVEGTNTFTLGSALASPQATNPNGYTYSWTVQHNGQTVATGSASSFTFTTNDWGDYQVSLQVTDPAGTASFVNTQTISITNLPPTITNITAPSTAHMGTSVKFTATATDPGPADVSAGLTFTWSFGDYHHGTGSTVTHVYKSRGDFTVTLIVTDAGGAKIVKKFKIKVT